MKTMTPRLRSVPVAWSLVLVVLTTSLVRADGYPPDEARRRMVLPDGFAAQVFASEPEVRQPVAACFDERGRMWVVEYLQYPNPAGLRPVSVDVYLRTEYDRVPEPPPRGPKGADRIKVLEDTDGDGKADKVTTFLEGLNLASAIAVGHGGVFVAQAPYLLFYPDRDRDDRPDGDPEVLLSGFGLQDAHAVVNSLAWGPDGWLYGAQGSTVTARIQGNEFQQGIWRYHPRTRRFELFAEGGGNTWGLDFDRMGNAFGSSNGAFIAFHMVQGGNYWKGFAKHGPLHNPRAFGYFDSLAYDGPKQGGHVTPGGIIYKADAYPEEFRGAFIGGNLLSNAVYWHKLTPKGSTFGARHGGTLIDARDSWFRPIDLLTGPDGCVYVVDWYDKRASHLDPRDNWDRSNGRIYRVTYKDTPTVPTGDLSRLSSDRLLAFREHSNDWYPEMARRLLAERRDASVAPKLKQWLLADRDATLALRDLWALYVSGGLDGSLAETLLDHPVADVRAWTVRLVGDDGALSPNLRDRLARLARDETSVVVRAQMASSCQRFATRDALAILAGLFKHDEDVADRQVPLLLWWAVERHLRDDPSAVVAPLVSGETAQRPLVRTFLMERLARALVSSSSPTEFALTRALLNADEAPSAPLIAGLEKGLEGRLLADVPEGFGPFIDRLMSGDRPGVAALKLAARLGSAPALAMARERARDARGDESERLGNIELLAQSRRAEDRDVLFALLRDPGRRTVRYAALGALGGFDQPEVAEALIEVYPTLDAGLQDRARDLLTSRPSWADALIEAMARGRIAAKDIKPSQAQQVARLEQAVLTTRLEKVWGKVPGPDTAAKDRRIAEVRGFLVEGDKGKVERGKAVFDKQCAGCHRLFGEGATVGPELTGAERNLDALLENIVDPSRLIRKEYQAQVVALKDGRVLTGLIVEESGASLTLFDPKQEKTIISRNDVEEIKSAEVSLMPEGLLDGLTEGDVRDLFKYLQSAGLSK
jgi:putative membrane-bound dehydrogenase-like protein